MRRRIWLGAALGVLAALCGSPADAADLTDFGYLSMKTNGVESRGSRPLVTVLASFAGKPAFRADARDYFDKLVYNSFQKSVNGYNLVNSNGRFFWARAGAGTIGPLNFSAADGNLPERQRLARVKEALFNSGFNVADFDDNHDGRVTDDELAILVIDNLSERGAAMRSSDPVGVRPPGATVTLASNMAAAAHHASLMSITHELSHLMGTLDMYGSNDLNQALTLMGATIYDNDDDRRTYHLDPWHKTQLGWSEPRLQSLRSLDSVSLPAANMVKPDAPVILYDPARGASEYFILEYRADANMRGLHYDENVANNGLVIWHVKQDANKRPLQIPGMNGYSDNTMFTDGAPDFVRGGNIAWHSGAVTPSLRWLDGTSTQVRLAVRSFAEGASAITVDLLPGAHWRPWFRIGGGGAVAPGSPVTAVARKAEQLDLFVAGNDGAVYSAYWNPVSGWNGFFSVGAPAGGIRPGSTITAVARKAEQLDLFATGNDGGIYSAYWSGGGWSSWFRIGGLAVPQKAVLSAVARKAEQLDLFVAAPDGGIYSAYWSPASGWQGWFRIGAANLVPPGSPVTAVARKAEQLDLFVAGNDGAVYSAYWNPVSGWSGFFSVGSPGSRVAPGSQVSAVARKAEQLDLFTVGSDGGVYSAYWSGGGWSSWFRIGGLAVSQKAIVSVVARKPEQLDLFTVGSDGGVYSAYWSGGAWSGWFRIGEAAARPKTLVSAVARKAEQLDLFTIGSDGGIYSAWWGD